MLQGINSTCVIWEVLFSFPFSNPCGSVNHSWYMAMMGSGGSGEDKVEKQEREERNRNWKLKGTEMEQKCSTANNFRKVKGPQSFVCYNCTYMHIYKCICPNYIYFYNTARSSASRVQRWPSLEWRQASVERTASPKRKGAVPSVPCGYHFSLSYLVTFSCSGAGCFEEGALKACSQQAVVSEPCIWMQGGLLFSHWS